jgi:hypothetical protein
MAKVNFYRAKFNFSDLLALSKKYPKEADFSYLIFQSQIDDSNKRNDDYILTAYVVGGNMHVQEPVSSTALLPDTSTDPFEFKGKLFFANYYWSREKIEELIKTDPGGSLIDYVLFSPNKYPRSDRYVHYTYVPVYKAAGTALGDEGALNPSPPADPGS